MISFGLIAGILSQGSAGDGGGATEASWTFDERYLDGSQALGADSKSVSNSGADNSNSVHTKPTLFSTDESIYYWEHTIEAGDSGPRGSVGVVDAYDLPDVGEDPFAGAAIARVLTGALFHDSAAVTFDVDNATLGDILMMAFQPSTGSLWIGTNGVWRSDPDSEPADVVSTVTAEAYRISVVPEETSREIGLASEDVELTYTVPTACVPLADAPIAVDLSVDLGRVYAIESPRPAGTLAARHQRIITIEE